MPTQELVNGPIDGASLDDDVNGSKTNTEESAANDDVPQDAGHMTTATNDQGGSVTKSCSKNIAKVSEQYEQSDCFPFEYQQLMF